MNSALPVVTAGATFAVTTLLGLVAGAWVARATGQGLWVLAGIFGGLALGVYCAYRLLLRSM